MWEKKYKFLIRSILFVQGLQNNTFYDVMVRSQNKYGWSPYSKVQTFRTAQLGKTLKSILERAVNFQKLTNNVKAFLPSLR